MAALTDNILTRTWKIFENGDPLMDKYFLMQSPLPIVSILVFYVVFVFKIGPAWMKNRKPLKVDGIVTVYNLLQIVLNAVIFVKGLEVLPKANLFCNPLDNSHTMVRLQYAYTMLKLFDLVDTIFFVVRKKYNQITFLHVYHHLLMASVSWIMSKFFIGGQVYFVGMPNLFVHVVMYFYYFLTSWDPSYKKSIWWKKHITQLQIVQHCFVFIAFVVPLLNVNCTYPKLLLGIFTTQATLMIVLFSNFYIKTYIRTPKSLSKEK